jgi:alpha-glucosidase
VVPVPEAHRALAVDVQESDRASLLWAFRRFLAWRRQMPALVWGTLERLVLPEPLVGFARAFAGQRVMAVFNLSGHAVALPAGERGRPLGGFTVRPDGMLGPFGVYFGDLATAETMAPS